MPAEQPMPQEARWHVGSVWATRVRRSGAVASAGGVERCVAASGSVVVRASALDSEQISISEFDVTQPGTPKSLATLRAAFGARVGGTSAARGGDARAAPPPVPSYRIVAEI